MRIKSVCLEWFRGAGDEICLETNGKSVVIYGPNGAGKSCFVDSVEYITRDGKIGHLSHEYSGRKQEKGISNTSTPAEQKTRIKLKLSDDSELEVEIDEKGNSSFTGNPTDNPRNWNYRRTVLRQDEVSDFIKQTKANKYSALLPLLGFEQMEIAAGNIHTLTRKIESESNLKVSKASIAEVARRQASAEASDSLENQIKELHGVYCPDSTATDFALRTDEVIAAIVDRIQRSTDEQRRHVLLQQIATLEISDAAERVRELNEKIVASVEPRVAERLRVLENVSMFLGTEADQTVSCPACGQVISTDDFREHIDRESARLKDLSEVMTERKFASGRFCDNLRALQISLKNAELADWRSSLDAEQLTTIESIDVETLRDRWSEESIVDVLVSAQAVIQDAKNAEVNAPRDAQKLVADKGIADLCSDVSRIDTIRSYVEAVENLIRFLSETEQSIRNKLREQARAAMEAISTDIQRFWGILHPDVPIENVSIHLPAVDKAIDVHLKFYGKEQDSPRLTLSEGYRNSLGLCIFLAMVKFGGDTETPIILDDVVVSLDRTHRGMIAELLDKEFSEYQVLVFTHDRDWYAELSIFLPRSTWEFKVLLPYDQPEVGIRWSTKSTTFEEARALLDSRPDAAGNDARKIMDTELALVAEKLQIRMPYLRAEKNDHRMAHDFATRLASASEKCFQRKEGDKWVKNDEALIILQDADNALLAWGNRGSHSHDLVKSEATKLIDICERALEVFKCSACGKQVWYAKAGGPEVIQCECGTIRWRYGKDEGE